MPKKLLIGVVTSDMMAKSRRVEIPRLVKHPKYGKYVRRRTVCYVHDEKNISKIGDSVEIVECPPKSKTKRWQLVRVVSESRQVDLAAMRAAARIVSGEADAGAQIDSSPDPMDASRKTTSDAGADPDRPEIVNDEPGGSGVDGSENVRGEAEA